MSAEGKFFKTNSKVKVQKFARNLDTFIFKLKYYDDK